MDISQDRKTYDYYRQRYFWYVKAAKRLGLTDPNKQPFPAYVVGSRLNYRARVRASAMQVLITHFITKATGNLP